jgi:hypothetical protein
MFQAPKSIQQWQKTASDSLPEGLLENAKPVVLRGFIAHWPIISHAQTNHRALQSYLLEYYNGVDVHVMRSDAKYKGRLFYNEDLSGFNFSRNKQKLTEVFSELNDHLPPDSATVYVGSTAVNSVFPGLRNDNDLSCLPSNALASIWMGNQTRIAAHYDAPDNIACVVAGQRRFTLFAPEQIDNLYVGPIDFTPAGQPASLVDFHQIDYRRFPKFKYALDASESAILAPGDAIYIPANWWHHVEALSDFNVLVNYWWRQVEDYIGVPGDALLHAMLAIKTLPAPQKKAWQHIFDHYIFHDNPHAHIPPKMLGLLGDVDATVARRLRALLINKLNR